MMDIVKQHEVDQKRQRDLEQECYWMLEDQQKHQQQMIEILRKG